MSGLDDLAEQVARAQAQNAHTVEALGPVVLDGWRCTVEMLAGFVAIAKAAGFSDEEARTIVIAQFLANLKTLG